MTVLDSGSAWEARRDGDAGLTMVEIVVALLILGVLLSGFAASLISFGRATAVNEHRVQATSLLTSLHEELQATPWNRAVLYESEVAGLDGVPGVDLSGDVPTFEGERIVTIPGPVNAGCPSGQPACGRLAYVPRASETAVIDDRSFRVFRIITEAPVTGGTEPELRRFVTLVQWQLLNRDYEQVFESVRAPTPTERDEDSPPEVRLFLINPRQIILDDEGRNRYPISVHLRLQPGGSDPRLLLNVLDDDGVSETVTIDLDVVVDFPGDATQALAWEYEIPASEYQFNPASPRIELFYERAATAENPSATVAFPGGYRLVFRDEDGALLSASGESVSGTSPTWFTFPTVDADLVQISPAGSPVYVGTIAGGNEDRFCQDISVKVSVEFPSEPPEGEEVAVQAWFAGTRTQVRDLQANPLEGANAFLLSFVESDLSPWVLAPGDSFYDRFHFVALVTEVSQDSQAEATSWLQVVKPATGACEEVTP